MVTNNTFSETRLRAIETRISSVETELEAFKDLFFASAGQTLLQEIDLADHNLTETAIQHITNMLDQSGTINGTLNLTGNADPNMQTLTFIANLTAKGWTITYGSSRTIKFTSTSSAGSEAVSLATIQVKLSGVATSDVIVSYSISGTAIPGSDYTAPNPLTVTIPQGSTLTNISIPVINDTDSEGNETIIITLTGVVSENAILGTNIVHTFIISNDDTVTLKMPVAYYPANEGTGVNIIYDSIGNNDLPAATIGWGSGHGSNSFAYNPSAGYIQSITVNYNVTNKFSMCFWAQATDVSMGPVFRNNANNYTILYENNAFKIYSNSTREVQTSAITLNQWYHIAVVINGHNCQWYFDGVSNASGSVTTEFAPISSINLGLWSNNYIFPGLLNNIYIFNDVISQAEVQACMNNTIIPQRFEFTTNGDGASIRFSKTTQSVTGTVHWSDGSTETVTSTSSTLLFTDKTGLGSGDHAHYVTLNHPQYITWVTFTDTTFEDNVVSLNGLNYFPNLIRLYTFSCSKLINIGRCNLCTHLNQFYFMSTGLSVSVYDQLYADMTAANATLTDFQWFSGNNAEGTSASIADRATLYARGWINIPQG